MKTLSYDCYLNSLYLFLKNYLILHQQNFTKQNEGQNLYMPIFLLNKYILENSQKLCHVSHKI
jgi:hypothetical protein